MKDCSTCKHAVFDHDWSPEDDEYIWFIAGCDIGGDPDDCEEYEEDET